MARDEDDDRKDGIMDGVKERERGERARRESGESLYIYSGQAGPGTVSVGENETELCCIAEHVVVALQNPARITEQVVDQTSSSLGGGGNHLGPAL